MSKHILLISNLYASREQPNRGIFIQQLAQKINEVEKVTVICPIPWRPKLFYKILNKPFPRSKDVIDGITIHYIQHVVIPKILRSTYGWFMVKALKPAVKAIHETEKVDLISAHWIYPDGYSAVKVAKQMNIPVTVHALGCDINEYTKYENRKKLIIEALRESDKIIVKSLDLENKIIDLGIDKKKITTIMNGVDSSKFFKIEQTEARRTLNLNVNDKILIFIGNIQDEKGLPYLIEALAIKSDPKIKLLIIGSGEDRETCEKLCNTLKIENQVTFLGAQPHHLIPVYLNAADALCLPSKREGCPNIVLESLSCGTPVLASRVGAVPQIITKSYHGCIVTAESPKELAKNIDTILNIKKTNTIDFKWFNWNDNAKMVIDEFNILLSDKNLRDGQIPKKDNTNL